MARRAAAQKSDRKLAKRKTVAPRSRRRTPSRDGRAARRSSDDVSRFRLTHPDRVVYPEHDITKLQLAEYYMKVADWILPHIVGRPLSLVRCPEGASGPCFFQKHPPAGLSASVERIKIQEGAAVSDYLVVNDLEGIVSLVQFGALELHVWGSRADDVEHPDRLVFDLDPDPSLPWARVVEGAFLVREALESLDLASFVKTTGGKGIHVVAPIARRTSWDEAKQFTRAIADWIVSAAPDRYIANMSKAARRGKIFVDYLRNQRGATAVVGYSTRSKASASVSMPVDWSELTSLHSAADFNVMNVPPRLARQRRDPWRDIDRTRQSITAAAKKKLRLSSH